MEADRAGQARLSRPDAEFLVDLMERGNLTLGNIVSGDADDLSLESSQRLEEIQAFFRARIVGVALDMPSFSSVPWSLDGLDTLSGLGILFGGEINLIQQIIGERQCPSETLEQIEAINADYIVGLVKRTHLSRADHGAFSLLMRQALLRACAFLEAHECAVSNAARYAVTSIRHVSESHQNISPPEQVFLDIICQVLEMIADEHEL